MQQAHPRIDLNEILKPGPDFEIGFTLILFNGDHVDTEYMLDLKFRLQRQIDSNIAICFANEVKSIGGESNRTFGMLIDSNADLDVELFKSALNIFFNTDTSLMYADFEIKNGQDYEKVKLPAWSPIRYESIDYLGAVLVFDIESLKLELDQCSSREIIIQRAIDCSSRVSRFPHTLYKVTESVATGRSTRTPGDQANSISVVIPTRGIYDEESSLLERCINSLIKQEVSSRVEVIVVTDSGYANEIVSNVTNLVPQDWDFKHVEFMEPFNFSKKCNLGAAKSSGEVLLFLNDDVVISSNDALAKISSLSLREGVGAVGSILKFRDGSIQHAGISLREIKPRNAYLDQFPHSNLVGDTFVTHEVSAATGAFLAVSKQAFEFAGGWNENLPNSYNDVDFCLRLNQLGLQTVVANGLEIIHHESVSRDASFDENAFARLKTLWPDDLGNEMYLRSQEASGVGYEGPWGINKELRKDFSGKYVRYFIHLVQDRGFRKATVLAFQRISGKRSGLAGFRARNYL